MATRRRAQDQPQTNTVAVSDDSIFTSNDGRMKARTTHTASVMQRYEAIAPRTGGTPIGHKNARACFCFVFLIAIGFVCAVVYGLYLHYSFSGAEIVKKIESNDKAGAIASLMAIEKQNTYFIFSFLLMGGAFLASFIVWCVISQNETEKDKYNLATAKALDEHEIDSLRDTSQELRTHEGELQDKLVTRLAEVEKLRESGLDLKRKLWEKEAEVVDKEKELKRLSDEHKRAVDDLKSKMQECEHSKEKLQREVTEKDKEIQELTRKRSWWSSAPSKTSVRPTTTSSSSNS